MKESLAGKISSLNFSETISTVKVGKIIRIDESGQVTVDFVGNTRGPLSARFTDTIGHKLMQLIYASNPEVILIFENNDPGLPIIIDTISSQIEEIAKSEDINLEVDKPKEVTVDGEKITFDARDQIVIKCGKSSITLTRAGKIIIRGAYLLNRSSGVNRIKGGSVQIN